MMVIASLLSLLNSIPLQVPIHLWLEYSRNVIFDWSWVAFIWMQWLRQLFSTKTKFKNGDGRKAYSIHHPEPRLYFALCAGSYSDPAVCSAIHILQCKTILFYISKELRHQTFDKIIRCKVTQTWKNYVSYSFLYLLVLLIEVMNCDSSG
jgi:hypothetical protein